MTKMKLEHWERCTTRWSLHINFDPLQICKDSVKGNLFWHMNRNKKTHHDASDGTRQENSWIKKGVLWGKSLWTWGDLFLSYFKDAFTILSYTTSPLLFPLMPHLCFLPNTLLHLKWEVRIPMVVLGKQPSHKTSDLQCKTCWGNVHI